MKKRATRIGLSLLVVALFVHFTVAASSAAKYPLYRAIGHNRLARALTLYAYLSGTGSYFGFFAPGVISQLQVKYDLLREGQPLSSGVIGSENPEISLRLHNLVQQFWNASKRPEVRRALATSLAGSLLSASPSADEVRITLRAFVLPSMSQYRDGMRPNWETSYVGTFRRDGQGNGGA